jgi:hypothetical protein
LSNHGILIVSLTLYKTASLATAVLFCFFGYRLFLAGLWGPAGDLRAKFKEFDLILKSAAPGVFFVVMGALIAGATIWKGFDFDIREDGYRSRTGAPLVEKPPLP